MRDPADQPAIWHEEFDLDQPVSDLIEPEWLEPIILTLDEMRILEELGREYAQELLERNMIADLPPMDMPSQILEQVHDRTDDFGR